MKIVRENLNEIKRGNIESGLGALNIGHIPISGLAIAKKEIPFII